ncbi:MAG: cell division protein SepF [Actinobacteria bacterium]|nr:cell division protein SepF [Actinomycetota bacterium]MCL6105331.1 cell division protein SepF [Actinomycetota bacterium]
MASAFVERAMVYLGLKEPEEFFDDSEDNYNGSYAYPDGDSDDQGDYIEDEYDSKDEYDQKGGKSPIVKLLPNNHDSHTNRSETGRSETGRTETGRTETGRPHVDARPRSATSSSSKIPELHLMIPSRFADSQELCDRIKNGQPVIVNLQVVDVSLERRIIDFSSGVAYALGGAMKKVTDHVFVITPPGTVVSEEEHSRFTNKGAEHNYDEG